ncbi:MAG: thioredoxin [Erysipelotrichaceae bacterium]|nr:thioredoxin [Erysipelotrichaceae bacterium]MDE6475955.1 thioredoxin [Erysipelotrichaceae bacterium]
MKIITKAEFEQMKDQGVFVVDFFANWCGPCKMVGPVLEELAKEYEGRATIVKVDVDQEQELAAQFNIMTIPTIIVFKEGKMLKQVVGFQPKPQLAALIDKAL